MEETLIQLSDDFPLQAIIDVGTYLKEVDVLVADFPDPQLEVCLPEYHLYESLLSGAPAILLPDRNVVSRMARAAKGERLDSHGRNAAELHQHDHPIA